MCIRDRIKSKWFTRDEFQCRCGCGFATVDAELLQVLEDVREYFNSPVIINSSCRCEKHNKAEGGASKSKHLLGIAADIKVSGVVPGDVYGYLNSKYKNKYGIGNYSTFTHIDIRATKARF